MSSADLSDSLAVVEVKPGKRFTKGLLRRMLPDVETTLFFGKVYDLDAGQLGTLLHTVVNTTLSRALFGQDQVHSHELQGYIADICDHSGFDMGDVTIGDPPPHGEILPEVWEQLEVEVATSIKAVAEKLEGVVDMLPGKNGEMLFKSMMTLNAKRPTLGNYQATIHHGLQQQNLLILDVSGSMTADTIHTIIEDVVALSYKANAALAVVSNHCTFWEPGTYNVDDVLAACEFAGTHYEELAPLFDRDWGTVITVADYDSSLSAKQHLLDECVGRVGTVLDISLVNQPSFLAECIGQFASEVRPLIMAAPGYRFAW
jgi:hypothetical protein